MTKADDRRVRKALQGADFPASKEELVEYARERGTGARTLLALQGIPAGTYDDSDAVERVVPQSPEAGSGG